jgi:hypothetical protein
MPTDFREIARQKAAQYGLIPEVFERQIQAESGFNPKAGSSAGARGIAQIMPATAKGWGVNPEDPVASLNAAAKNMAGYIKTYLGGKAPSAETDPVKLRAAYEKGLRAYNAGPGAVEESKKYAETNRYVQKIIDPNTFSFTEALKGQSTTQQPQKPQEVSTASPGGRTFIVYGDGEPTSAESFLNDYIKRSPKIDTGINPLAMLAQAFETPNYLG